MNHLNYFLEINVSTKHIKEVIISGCRKWLQNYCKKNLIDKRTKTVIGNAKDKIKYGLVVERLESSLSNH